MNRRVNDHRPITTEHGKLPIAASRHPAIPAIKTRPPVLRNIWWGLLGSLVGLPMAAALAQPTGKATITGGSDESGQGG